MRPEPKTSVEPADDQAPPSPFPNTNNYAAPPVDAVPGQAPGAPDDAEDQGSAFIWTASEYVAHHKDSLWYGKAVAITFLAAVIVYLVTRDIISVITIIIVGTLFCVAAARKPRTITYALDDHGLTVGSRFYPYTEFKSFSVVRDGAFASVELVPLKRFMPPTNVFFAPDDEDTVMEILTAHVPFQERPSSVIDRFGRYIRF